jgi:hypothetical protein
LCEAWYTCGAVIASKLPTGRTPKILKTLELFPIGRQRTKAIKLFGEDRYRINLTKDDLFATVIDARIDVQNELADELTPEDRGPFSNRVFLVNGFLSPSRVTVLSAVGVNRRNIWSEAQVLQCPQGRYWWRSSCDAGGATRQSRV